MQALTQTAYHRTEQSGTPAPGEGRVAVQAEVAHDRRSQRPAPENLALGFEIVRAVVRRLDLDQRLSRIDPGRSLGEDHQGGMRGVDRRSHQQVKQRDEDRACRYGCDEA